MSEPQAEERNPFEWEKRFREHDTPWERKGLHPAFLHWRDQGAFKPGERVIIPGCGRSPEVLAFAEAGLNPVGADLSPTALAWQAEQAEARGLQAELIEGDVLDLRFDRPFDLFYEQTFLCAIPPRRRGEYESAAHGWLRPGGRLLALFMQKEERGGPPYGCDMADMRVLFPAERWLWPEAEAQIWPHPDLGGKAELGLILTRR